jgi:hypothetical protein
MKLKNLYLVQKIMQFYYGLEGTKIAIDFHILGTETY